MSGNETARGTARSPARSTRDILLGDDIAPPAPILVESNEWLGDVEVPVERYTSRAFHQLEVERLWTRTWQMACRLEQLPEVGDHLLYEVAGESLIVVRSSPTEIRAFHNSCLHRGRALVDEPGQGAIFRCQFHGFAWNLDGTFRGMPASWDFPTVNPDDFCLPEARVALWGGFVFVNMDPDAEPFESYAAPLIEHFAHFPLDDRYLAHHACQVVPANWKVVQEAFLEGYHVMVTHPQAIPVSSVFEIQYDTFGPNVSRLIQPSGTPSPELVQEWSEEAIARGLLGKRAGADQVVPEGSSARQAIAAELRPMLSAMFRTDLSGESEAFMLDATQYFLFPNFFPWIGYAIPLVYRFRPWGDDPDQSLMELMLLYPIPDDGPYEVAAPHWLEPGQSWGEAPGFERFGEIIDQDVRNLPRIQQGLRASRAESVLLSDYQESRIRHFHHRLAELLD